jgi:hypothetical protein
MVKVLAGRVSGFGEHIMDASIVVGDIQPAESFHGFEDRGVDLDTWPTLQRMPTLSSSIDLACGSARSILVPVRERDRRILPVTALPNEACC